MTRTLPRVGARVSVVGTCGSGKTTLARALADRLSAPFVELDALSWGPRWTPVPDPAFREAVARAADGARWVIDGNYSKCRDLIWSRADTVVWLDYRFPRVFARLLRRTLVRSLRGDVLWNGNRERLLTSFLSRDSILLWAIRTYARRRREIPRLLARPEFRHLTTIRLRSPREASVWLNGLAGPGAAA